jgi:3-oxoacyl-[acyl-carrier protein] reductase
VSTADAEASEGSPGSHGSPGTGDADEGRVVLVTGGSRGIGAACAAWFLANGDRVAVTYRGETPPALPRPGSTDRFLTLRCDVTDPAQIEAAFAGVEAHWGPVEVLVANAGITRDTLVLRMSDDAWTDVIDTNLTGAFRVAKRAIARMLRLHRGRIILMSSVGAYMGLPGQANYAASKAGLVGMARALAREVASRQITVNVVAPGVVETDMTAALGADRLEQMRALVPLGRVGTSAEVAEVVGFLASAGAAYVTGAVVPVDGGLGMGL